MIGLFAAAVITAADSGSRVSLELGERLTIVLEAKPGAGISWVPETVPLLKFEKNEFGEAARPGAPADQRMEFVATKRGRARLRLRYGHPWRKQEAKKKFEIEVVVH